MPDNPYYSPSQISLYINGYHVDDAISISYSVQDQKTPIYGYNDHEFRTLVKSRSIVQGELDIHFRFFGYLTWVIEKVNSTLESLTSAKDLQLLKHFKNVDKNMEVFSNIGTPNKRAEAISILLSSGRHRQQRANELLDELKSRYWRQPEDALDPQSRSRPGLSSEDFDIVIQYGNVIEKSHPLTSIMIKGARIIGQSSVISGEVPDGGVPVRETYQFVAKSIVPGPRRS